MDGPQIEAPKTGTETSSYRLVWLTIIFAVLAPLPPLVASIIVQKGWLPGTLAPAVEQVLSQMLVGVSAVVGVSGAYVTGKALPAYIQQRGTVAKIKALAAAGLPQAGAVAPQPEKEQPTTLPFQP